MDSVAASLEECGTQIEGSNAEILHFNFGGYPYSAVVYMLNV